MLYDLKIELSHLQMQTNIPSKFLLNSFYAIMHNSLKSNLSAVAVYTENVTDIFLIKHNVINKVAQVLQYNGRKLVKQLHVNFQNGMEISVHSKCSAILQSCLNNLPRAYLPLFVKLPCQTLVKSTGICLVDCILKKIIQN